MIKNVGFWRTRVFLVLTAMTLFIACQKDDDGSPPSLEAHRHRDLQPQNNVTSVSLDDIPKVAAYLSTLGDHRGHFTINKSVGGSNRSNESDLVIGTLQTTEIIQVTDQYDRKNHTFLLNSIESSDATVKSTFNLVVQESHNGLFSYITEYRPDEDWIPNYRDSQDFSTFSGEIIHYSITGRYIAKLSLMNGIAINGETRSPCPDDGEPSGGGGNEGNPSPGESGPGDGGGNGDNPPPDPDVSADLKWLCVWRQQLHNEPSECNNQAMGGSWVIVITYGDKSVEDTVRCPDDLPELPEMCNDGNGDPCDCAPDGVTCMEEEEEPEDTDTNPTVGIIIQLSNPCAKINNALNDHDIANFIADLDGAHTEQNERGYGVSKNPDTGDFTAEGVQGGRRSTPLPVGGNIVGAGHIHTSNGYPMFSGDDVANLLLLYFRNGNRTHPTNPTYPDDVFSYLETSLGSYFLTVDNISALNAIVGTPELFDRIQKKLNRAYRKSDPNSQSDFVKTFFKTINKVLEDENVLTNPLRMFRLNSNNITLVELVLDENGEVNEKEPCND